MREYRLAVATAAAALALAVIGALVGDGGVLACPDWPLCQGHPLPAATGPVLVEQGHRIVALGLAVLTAVLVAQVVRNRVDPGLRRLAFAALALVAVQAAIGALTVVFGLPVLGRIGHLVTAMAFFALVVHLAARLRPDAGGPARGDPTSPAHP